MTDKGRSARAPTYFELMDAYERQLLKQALEQAFGNELEAAQSLRLSAHTFELKCDRLDIDRRKHRLPSPTARAEW